MNDQLLNRDFLDPLVEETDDWLKNSLRQGTLSIDSSYIDYNTLSVNAGNYKVNQTMFPAVDISDKGIQLGNDADIKIGNISLKDSIKRIEERLNILTVNHQLEKDWEELRALGQKYRDLEKDIMDKMSVWNVLSKD